MTFKHKLAHRLALLRDRGVVVAVAGLALLWVASCEKPVSVTEPNSSVAQLVVSPKVVTLQENQVQDFLAVGLTATGDTADISVTWSATVGTVDTSTSGKRHYGHYHNGGCGPSKLVARSHPGDFTDTATITVACPPAPVASVSLTPAAASVLTGQTVQLTATPKDANGNPLGGRVVTWSSDNTTIATVSASGLVTANAVGSATITATSEGQSGASAITVSTVPVASVAVSPATASLSVGQTALLTATPKDANGNPLTGRAVTWSTDNGSVATVSGTGLVTAAGAGSATITATSEGKSGTASVTVTAPTGQFAIGDSVQTTVSTWVRNTSQPPADPVTGTPPSVIGTQPAGARGVVDSGPVLNTTAGGDGAIRYHVLFASGTSGWVVQGNLAKIVPTVPVASVTVSPATASLTVGQTAQLTATPKDANGNPLTGRTITWSSSDNTIATVSGSGLVTGVGPGGPVTITATSEGQSGTAAVNVTLAPVASVTVAPSTANIAITGTVQLTATPKDANGNPLTGRAISWSSSDNTIGTVNGSGLVTGVAAGSVTITATSEGKSGTASVTVAGAPVASVTVTPASASVQAGQTQQLTATLKDANGNILTGRTVTWSSNNTSVATVSSSGLVTAKVAGSATITATSEGKSGTSALTVTPVPVASVTVAPASASVAVGATLQLTATPKDANGNPLTGRVVTWQSSNNTIAGVNGSGLVSGVAAGGPVTITATSEGKSGSSSITVTASSGGSQFGHVFVVTEENTDYSSVIGSSSMPYLNGLAQQYGLATQYYANTHPSIGNYFMLATGQIITNDDNFSTVQNVPNIVRSLLAAGKTWKSYAEDIPNACYLGGDTGNYARKHNVFPLLSDVANDPLQACNNVPFTQFATDLANGTLPHFSNIVPNLCNDAHDCGLSTADTWLKNNIDPLIKSATFQQDGLLIIVFDEAGSDNTNGGGRIVWVAVSPKSKLGYQSTTLYQHQSTLRLILKGLGINVFPGAAANAPDMSEFFTP
ncbi:MAG TPA: Ig-like domain-containing protein [Gemmatimonadales bacterium]|nr:Ig-like domain-containing protein [Gemmatimonadales bacterium]HYR98925.1 Ig-like domain-containing protein [Gemmatimonadales bacterium]